LKLNRPEVMWLDESHQLSMDELFELSELTMEELHHLVASGALIPNNPTEEVLHFNSHFLITIRTLSRLKHDFELEPSAYALTLIFLERIRDLEYQLHELNQKTSLV